MTANENQVVAQDPNNIVSEDAIRMMIVPVRGVQVMLDRDLAALYGVEVKYLNRQVKRNIERFPEDFMFRLSAEEWDNLKCQIGISSWGGDRQLPYAFTENGVPKHLISPADIATFSAQYPKLAVRYNETFHDRFLIIDDKELYLIGTSLKDLGRKCFAFTKLDSADIRRIKKLAFLPAP